MDFMLNFMNPCMELVPVGFSKCTSNKSCQLFPGQTFPPFMSFRVEQVENFIRLISGLCHINLLVDDYNIEKTGHFVNARE
jgi:hypothetical protein